MCPPDRLRYRFYYIQHEFNPFTFQRCRFRAQGGAGFGRERGHGTFLRRPRYPERYISLQFCCSMADVQIISLAFRTSGYWETVSLLPWSGRASANAMPKSHSTCGGRTLQVTCPAIGSCEGRGGGSRSEWSDTRRLRKRVGWKSVDMPCR